MKTEMLRLLNEHGLADANGFVMPLAESYGRPSPVTPVDMTATVALHVIPRLRSALAARIGEPAGSRSSSVSLSDRREETRDRAVEDLIDRLLNDDFETVCDRIRAFHLGGMTLERVYLDHLMPVALRLAERHADDLLGLAETTVAFCNLQRVLHRFSSEFGAEEGRPETGFRALLVAPAAPGCDPNLPAFGLLLMSEFFRRDGWDAWTERNCKSGSFRDTVLTEWFDLVEVLAHSDRDLDEIASGIRLIRRGAPNRAVGVIACGRVFHEHPEFVRMVGADRSASDPLSSLAEAKKLVALPANRRLLS